MTYDHLFNRAYALCVKANSRAIADDLAYMSETKLMGVINFLSKFLQS